MRLYKFSILLFLILTTVQTASVATNPASIDPRCTIYTVTDQSFVWNGEGIGAANIEASRLFLTFSGDPIGENANKRRQVYIQDNLTQWKQLTHGVDGNDSVLAGTNTSGTTALIASTYDVAGESGNKGLFLWEENIGYSTVYAPYYALGTGNSVSEGFLSPNGEFVIITSNRHLDGIDYDFNNRALLIWDKVNGLQQLSTGILGSPRIFISEDGSRIAYSTTLPDSTVGRIHYIDLDTAQPEMMEIAAGYQLIFIHSISHDGRKILFHSTGLDKQAYDLETYLWEEEQGITKYPIDTLPILAHNSEQGVLHSYFDLTGKGSGFRERIYFWNKYRGFTEILHSVYKPKVLASFYPPFTLSGNGSRFAFTSITNINGLNPTNKNLGFLADCLPLALPPAPEEFTVSLPVSSNKIVQSNEDISIMWNVLPNVTKFAFTLSRVSPINETIIATEYQVDEICDSLHGLCVPPIDTSTLEDGQYQWTVAAVLPSGTFHATNSPLKFTLQTTTFELIENGGFEESMTSWKSNGLNSDKLKCNKSDKKVAYSGVCSFQFKSSPLENSKIHQTIDVSNLELLTDNELVVSAYSKATSNGTKILLSVHYLYNYEYPDEKVVLDIPTTNEYQQTANSIHLSSRAIRLKVTIKHQGTSGKVLLDDVSLKVLGNSQDAPQLIPLPVN
jgi:hypothetical protein